MTTPEQLETRMLRDRAAIRDEQLAQAQENALLLYQALAKHAPDALAEIKPRLHANIREMDKVVCEVTAAREEAARLRKAAAALAEYIHEVDEARGVVYLRLNIAVELGVARSQQPDLYAALVTFYRAAAVKVGRGE